MNNQEIKDKIMAAMKERIKYEKKYLRHEKSKPYDDLFNMTRLEYARKLSETINEINK
jgi:hypothetical protein